MLHSDSARASYVLATVKMMILQNNRLAREDSLHIAGVGQSEHVLTHATHAWHRSVGCMTDVGYMCDQLSIFDQNETVEYQSALHNSIRQDHLKCCVCVSMVCHDNWSLQS